MVYGGDILEMEPHAERHFGSSPREYYIEVGYSNPSEVAPATWVGLCVPTGE